MHKLNSFSFPELSSVARDLKSLAENKLSEFSQHANAHPEAIRLLRDAVTAIGAGEVQGFFSYRDLLFYSLAIGRAISPTSQARDYSKDPEHFMRTVEKIINGGAVFVPVIQDTPWTQRQMLENLGISILPLQLPSHSFPADGIMRSPFEFLTHDLFHAERGMRGPTVAEHGFFLLDPGYKTPFQRMALLAPAERRSFFEKLAQSWRDFILRVDSAPADRRNSLRNVIFELFHEDLNVQFTRLEPVFPGYAPLPPTLVSRTVTPSFDPPFIQRLLRDQQRFNNMVQAVTKSIHVTNPNFPANDARWALEWIRDNIH